MITILARKAHSLLGRKLVLNLAQAFQLAIDRRVWKLSEDCNKNEKCKKREEFYSYKIRDLSRKENTIEDKKKNNDNRTKLSEGKKRRYDDSKN